MKKRALISVFNKTGLVNFVDSLVHEFDYEIISTGGTANELREAGLSVLEVSDVTGFPEMLDGRVKSMHPKIIGGVIADQANPKHMEQIEANQIERIHMVVCNLYDFQAKPSIEMIDVGGPTMLRSAAKNCESCIVVTHPVNYVPLLAEMRALGEVSLGTRLMFADEVWKYTSEYDRRISIWWPTLMNNRLAAAADTSQTY